MTKRILAVMVLVSTLTLVRPAPAAAHWNCAYPILPFVGAVIALPGQILGSLVYGPAGYGPAAYGPAPYAPPVYYAPPPVYGPAVVYGPRGFYGPRFAPAYRGYPGRRYYGTRMAARGYRHY